ncbi:MAG: hypothetical protein GXC72_04705 [Chitinophagaceae bacterium]|nr:hypothetical protein [Chitinophagaceae bacterium]
MQNYATMTANFEREKNLKASAITLAVCAVLFLFFYMLQWTLPQIPEPDFGEGIEVNLGNSETGLGDIAPQIPGEPSATAEQNSAPVKSVEQTAQPNISGDENETEEAAVVNKTVTKPVTKPIVKENPPVKKPVNTVVSNPTPTPPKPKAVFKGGTSTTTSGNGADSYNGVRNQGVAGGTGDQGNPNGNPNSDSYKGNAASGNGGGGGTGGVNIRSGLTGRRITKYPSFEDEFNEAATVMVNITVDQAGNVINATINPKGTSTTNINIRNIARQKAYLLKLNTGSATEQTGTIAFVFKLRG